MEVSTEKTINNADDDYQLELPRSEKLVSVVYL